MSIEEYLMADDLSLIRIDYELLKQSDLCKSEKGAMMNRCGFYTSEAIMNTGLNSASIIGPGTWWKIHTDRFGSLFDQLKDSAALTSDRRMYKHPLAHIFPLEW